MQLAYSDAYRSLGLTDSQVDRLSGFADALLNSPVNVSSIHDTQKIEEHHFLDALSLLGLPEVRMAGKIIDVGTGGGIPSVVLAVSLPFAGIFALEASHKKCRFVESVARSLGLDNLHVVCTRAEDYGLGEGREEFDVAVSRAVAALPVVLELSLPLLRLGGIAVAMKGELSDQERIEGERALAILGGSRLRGSPAKPFPGAVNRFLYSAYKINTTPPGYPRRSGIPAKKPLGR